MRKILIFALYISSLYFALLKQVEINERRQHEAYVASLVTLPIPEVQLDILPFREIQLQRISAYNPVPRQTDASPDVSSCGPNLERQIAISQDLFFDENGRKHLCGQRVTIVTDRGEVFTDYIIWDTMNVRYTNTVDVFIPNTDEAEAYSFGITKGVLYMYD